MIRVGVVGLGYWGPNLARNFAAIPGCEVSWLCDASQEAREKVAQTLPGARLADDIGELLGDGELDAVVLATPVPTHAALATRVLEAGKHCFVEKPLATTVADAQLAVDAAARAGKLLMVGHLLEYHPAVTRLKELVEGGELGELFYLYGNRVNLGKLRADENALWSLGAHDVSVVLHLIGEDPVECTAHGRSFVRAGVEDVVFCYLRFPSGVVAHLHLSWLDPHKERRLTVVGARRMATFDDMLLQGKLTVWDKGFDEDARCVGGVRGALRRELLAAHRQCRAAESGVRTLRGVRQHGDCAALGWSERAAGCARLGGAAGVAYPLTRQAWGSNATWRAPDCS